MDDLDVVIIGGGLSGLSAAYHLSLREPTLRFIVLEAKNRIGGRTLGFDLKTTHGFKTWDIGGQWIGKCQPHIYKLVNELGLETYEQFSNGIKMVQLSNTDLITQYTSDLPPISYFIMIELQLFIWKINRLVKKTNEKGFLYTKLAKNLDLTTLEQFKQSYFWTAGAKNTLDACCRCIFGTDPKHMSLLFFLLYIVKSGCFESLFSCKANFGAQELKIKGGAWQICEKLAEKLAKQCILTGMPVKSIIQAVDSLVSVECTNGQVLKCKYVILAIPPHEIIKIKFEPFLSKDKFQVFQRLPVGCLTKIIVTYSEAFWKCRGYSGEVLTSGASGKHPLCVVFDASFEPDCHALVAFVGGEQQISFCNKRPEERKELVLLTLSSFFGSEALYPLDYVEKDWNEEPFNGGCPVNVATPGVATSLTPSLFHPFCRVFFAGTESANSWSGFMNGAVQSGQRAAKEVLYNFNPDLLSDGDLEDCCYAKKKMSEASSVNIWKNLPYGFGGLLVFLMSLLMYTIFVA